MSARRFIVEIQSESISDEIAMECVTKVIANGHTSESRGRKQHCFLTTWKDGIRVACVLNKKSERFVVWRE